MVVGAYVQHKKQTKSEAYKYEYGSNCQIHHLVLVGPVPDQDRTEHLDLVPGRRIAGRPLLLAVPGGGY